MSTMMTLRLATERDADLLLEWRNDPETRKESHQTAIVRRDEHSAWLLQTLGNPNRKLLIAEEEGVPVGTIRADFSNGAWVLSWTTAPSERKRGVAKQMVTLFVGGIVEPICEEVKSGTLASARIAENAGMKFEREESGVIYYRRPAMK